jgi:hypothetical protein
MRWGDGSRKVVRVLEVPVAALEKALRQIRARNSRVWRELFRERSNWKWFQEKPLSFSFTMTVPQTDTGGRDEYSKALERTREKELGKLVP